MKISLVIFLLLKSLMVFAEDPTSTSLKKNSANGSRKPYQASPQAFSGGCVTPSANSTAPIEQGIVGGPQESLNNPQSLVFPSAGCKVGLPNQNK